MSQGQLGYAKVFDTIGSFYGPTAAPSYNSSQLQDGAKTVAANLSTNPVPSAPANTITILPQLEGTIFGQPVTHFFLLAFAAVGIYWLIHRHVGGVEKELAVPRISLSSFWSVGIQALLFIVLWKTVLTKYRIPGLTELVASA